MIIGYIGGLADDIYIGNLSNDSNHGYAVGLASYFSQIGI